MKHTLYTILAALIAIPAYAAPLNPDEWETIFNASPPETCFQFDNGKLLATGNTNGKELFYKPSANTPLMLNGSGLSITLQFETKTFMDNPESEITIFFHKNNSDTEGGGKDIFHSFHIFSSSGQLNIYDNSPNGSKLDDYLTLSTDDSITTITLNYTIENNYLCYSYKLNGEPSHTTIFDIAGVNPELAWRPSFGLANSGSNVFTVTDFSFSPIPEPATATLSLLALAGLAARRRRASR